LIYPKSESIIYRGNEIMGVVELAAVTVATTAGYLRAKRTFSRVMVTLFWGVTAAWALGVRV